MSTTSSYPVRVDADLQPGLSRWLWLVKWLLVIPHDIILAFLWVAFAVLSFVAFLAILVTGRYPRTIFDFNVGVLRWSWRVAYYAYGSLGTDQYPPFTLYERAGYPAHLDVAYPERLSRGLALVKWWLLAIPHYLVVGFFLGGSWYLTSAQGTRWSAPGGGLILVLVLVAAVVLLFTGRYPQSIFDLVLGLNRWVLRVAAYAALMTDDYPPFRLDMGGADPAVSRLAMPAGGGDPLEGGGPAAAGSTGLTTGGQGAAPGPSGGNEWGAGRVVAVVLGSVMFLVGCGLLLAGAGLGIADRALRDGQGYLMSPEGSLSTSGAALVSPSVQLQAQPASTFPHALLGTAKASIHAAGGQPLFVGVARSDRAAGYLAGVASSTVVELGGSGTPPRYRYHPGGLPPRAPEQAGIWVASAAGRGPQTISWPVRQGDWTLVVMNRDGSRGVVADVRIGATIPAAGWLVAALLITGAVVAVLAAVVLVAALSRPSPPQARTAAPAV